MTRPVPPPPPSFAHLNKQKTSLMSELSRLASNKEVESHQPQSTVLSELPPGYDALCCLYKNDIQNPAPSKWMTWFGNSPLHKSSKPLFKDYKAEAVVGLNLERLRKEGYHVIHSVPVDTGTISHVLVTPTGLVFLINVKHQENRKVTVTKDCVLVGNKQTDYIRKSVEELGLIRNRFSLPEKEILSILVLLGVKKLDVGADAYLSGVKTVKAEELLDLIWKEEKRHSELELASKLETLELTGAFEPETPKPHRVYLELPKHSPKLFDPATWTDSWEDNLSSKEEVLRWKKELEAKLSTAVKMRVLWKATGAVIFLGGVYLAVSSMTSLL